MISLHAALARNRRKQNISSISFKICNRYYLKNGILCSVILTVNFTRFLGFELSTQVSQNEMQNSTQAFSPDMDISRIKLYK